MPYNPNIPNASDFISDSQPQIKANFFSANVAFGTDHTAFSGVTNFGYHKPVHLISQIAADPAAVVGTDIIYAKDYTPDTAPVSVADTQLFSRTASGIISQLTGSYPHTEGYAWVGGILIQWGKQTLTAGQSHVTGNVTFQSRSAGNTIPFPIDCLNVSMTLTIDSVSSTSPTGNTIALRSFDQTKFTYVFNSNSGTGSTTYPGFFWVAIGH